MSEVITGDYLICVCPSCRTRFRASEELLNVADGQVRCGACLTVFNGRNHLLEAEAVDEEEPSAPKLPRQMHSANKAAPDRETAVGRQPSASAISRVTPLLSALLLIAALFASFLWLRFDVWSQRPEWRPVYESACEFVGCRLQTLRAIADIDVLSSGFAPRRGPPDQLELALQLRNQAAFAQPFPTLVVRLRDEQRKILATHRRAPKDYLDTHTELMEPSEETSIVLRFDDAGERAIDYRLSLL